MTYKPADADAGPVPFIAAIALIGAGIAHALLAAQYLYFYYLTTPQWLVVVAMLVFGLASVVAGWKVGQGSSWAAIAGLLLAPLLGLLSVGYSAYALWNGSFAFYSLFAPPAAALATLITPFAIAFCRRAEKAQAELRAKYGSGPFGSLAR